MYNPFIKNKIKKLHKEEDRKREFKSMNDIHKILVLFDTSDYEEVDSFIEQLSGEGKQVIAYAYKNKKDQYDYSETPYIIINAGEATDWFDNKLEDIAEEMNSRHYDALFDLSVKKNLALEYLAFASNVNFKVGYKKSLPTPYDLSISSLAEVPDKNESLYVRELHKQISHYLNTIRTT